MHDLILTAPINKAVQCVLKPTYIPKDTAKASIAPSRTSYSTQESSIFFWLGFRFLLLQRVTACPITSVPGPSDTRVHWLINGHSMDTPIMEYRLQLGPSEVLVSSWLKGGPLIKDAYYSCVAEAGAGSDVSEVELRLPIGGEEEGFCADQWSSSVLEALGRELTLFPGSPWRTPGMGCSV